MLKHVYDFVVIGSGISGISAANTLIKNDKQVLILDKARNSGGRLSTRIHLTFSFDHGAQFFTTKDLEFSQIVQKAIQTQEIAIFEHPEKGKVYVGNPVFRPFISKLTSPLEIMQNASVTYIEKPQDRPDECWSISIANNQPVFAENIILTMPAPQANVLLPDYLTELKQATLQAKYDPCIAILAGVEVPLSSSIFLENSNLLVTPIILKKGNISWSIAKWSLSYKKNTAYLSIIIHATPEFSSKNIDEDVSNFVDNLWEEWKSHIETDAKLKASALPKHISYIEGHKWRYARVIKTPDEECARTDQKYSIALGGDWLKGPRIESAWVSGRNAAISLLSKDKQ